MRSAVTTAALFGIAMLANASASAAQRAMDLDTWVTQALTPYLAETLSTHPRFRNEAVRFVVMQDGDPQASSTVLALSLRNRVRDTLVDTPGVRIAWQGSRVDASRGMAQTGIDCAANDAHYYVGIEIAESYGGRFAVTVRALDVEERSWVSGFGLSWEGLLSTTQYRAFREFDTDSSYRGDREVPYLRSQQDLLAAHLAHDLGCMLMRQVSGEYLADALLSADSSASADAIVELVSKNLAAKRALQFTNDGEQANARIEGKAHRIDDDLYQFWITVTPKDDVDELRTLSASAYIYMPEEFMAAETARPTEIAQSDTRPSVLTSVQLVELKDNPSWYALQTRTSRDAVLFYLHHQQNNGLVRLGDDRCERLNSARVSRAGQYKQFALPTDTISGGHWLPAKTWQTEPDEDSYYVIAVSKTAAARDVSRHIERLPMRCGTSVRPGLEGTSVRHWLNQFTGIADRWKADVDWTVVRVRNVY